MAQLKFRVQKGQILVVYQLSFNHKHVKESRNNRNNPFSICFDFLERSKDFNFLLVASQHDFGHYM